MAQMTTTLVRTQGFYLQGKWIEEGTPVEIHAPYDGAPLALVFQATREHAEKAIRAAVKAFGSTRRLPAFEPDATNEPAMERFVRHGGQC